MRYMVEALAKLFWAELAINLLSSRLQQQGYCWGARDKSQCDW